MEGMEKNVSLLSTCCDRFLLTFPQCRLEVSSHVFELCWLLFAAIIRYVI